MAHMHNQQTCLTTDLTSTTDPRMFEHAVIATIRVFCVISGKRELMSWATAYGLLEPFVGVACQWLSSNPFRVASFFHGPTFAVKRIVQPSAEIETTITDDPHLHVHPSR